MTLPNCTGSCRQGRSACQCPTGRQATGFGELTTATSACAVERPAPAPWSFRLVALAAVLAVLAAVAPIVWGGA